MTAVPSRGDDTRVMVPPAAARSLARTLRFCAPLSSRTLNESFTAVRVTGGGAAATTPVVTLASVEPFALDATRILAGAPARLETTACPPASATLNPSMVSVGGTRLSEEIALTVRVLAAGLNSAWVTLISSTTVPLKKAGTMFPSALRAAESFTQTPAGMVAGRVSPKKLVPLETICTSIAPIGASRLPAASALQGAVK